MKRLLPHWSLCILLVGILLGGLIPSNVACTADGKFALSAPTTQEADALVANAQADTQRAGDALARMKAAAATQPTVQQLQTQLAAAQAVAATQPSDAGVAAQVVNLQTAIVATNALNQSIATLAALQPKIQQGVNIAAGVEQAVYHGNPTGLVNAAAPLIPAPYNILIPLGLSLAWGAVQRKNATTAQQNHDATSAELDASNAALQQFAQATHAIAPDAIIAQITNSVDSDTRAAVAAAGVVHVADTPAPAAAAAATLLAAPNVQGTYALPLNPSNRAGT